jgi:hypothetical protein
MRLRLVPVLLLLAAGCALPQTNVTTPDTRPALAFRGAPEGAVLFVDGRRIGDPNAWDGEPQFLVVEPGTHAVVIQDRKGQTLYQEWVYVESEHKTIEVH